MNNGVFVCYNCGIGIHQIHYGVEVSYIKSICDDQWNHLQLRALINSGNKSMREFMEYYQLQYESVQKRYTTQAVQYYRDKLKAKIDGVQFAKEKPEYEQGRK